MTKKSKKHNYHQWCDDKLGRETYWKKTDYNAHTHHWEMISDEQVFFDTLEDPDIIYTDANHSPSRSIYYKYDVFTREGVINHSKIIAVDKPNLKPKPTEKPYVQIISAHSRGYVKEEQMQNVTVMYKKEEEQNE